MFFKHFPAVTLALAGFCDLFCFVIHVSCAVNELRTCNCALQVTNPPYHTLMCNMNDKNYSGWINEAISCQQVNDLVRIGPLDPDIAVESANNQKTIANRETIQLAPWAFANLMWDQTVRRLQLDLQLKAQPVNALSLGGLENLEELLGRTSYLRWDGCSLANLVKMRQVLLSCKSEYGEFLTLGPAVEVVRFVDCEDAPIQFYCVNCLQDPSVNVIRVRPGPPLRQYMVKFSQFNRSFDTGAMDPKSHLSIGRCMPNICSDSMLCRDNEALQKVLSNVGRPTTSTITTTTTTGPSSTTPPESVITSADTTGLIGHSLPENRTSSSTTGGPQYYSPVVTTDHTSNSDHTAIRTRNQRIWIAASIVSVITVFLITTCVLIGILRQRSRRRQRVKFNRPRPRQTKYTNGFIRDRPDLVEDDSSKLELPERVC